MLDTPPSLPDAAPSPMPPRGAHDRLRRETRDCHERLEAQVDMHRLARSRDGYRRTLEAMLGFYGPVEEALARLDWRPAGIEIGERRKAHLIAADLAALGLAPEAVAALPRCADLPDLPDLRAGLGCLYVLEGATLGGQLILREVRERLSLEPEGGASFFASYGPRVGVMWREFKARLDAACANEEAATAAVLAAAGTFEALERWLGERLQDIEELPRGDDANAPELAQG